MSFGGLGVFISCVSCIPWLPQHFTFIRVHPENTRNQWRRPQRKLATRFQPERNNESHFFVYFVYFVVPTTVQVSVINSASLPSLPFGALLDKAASNSSARRSAVCSVKARSRAARAIPTSSPSESSNAATA